MSDFQFFISFVFASILSIIVIALPINIYNKKFNKTETIITNGDKIAKISKVINIIWAVLFIPSIFLSLFAIVVITMGGETLLGRIGDFQIICLGISIWLFLIKPISIIISIILSFIYRKKENLMSSILIQVIPIIILLCAFSFMIIGFLVLVNV